MRSDPVGKDPPYEPDQFLASWKAARMAALEACSEVARASGLVRVGHIRTASSGRCGPLSAKITRSRCFSCRLQHQLVA